ncbi:hypothetical protein EAI_10321 [Harpegnathos saltator]|uniref:Uncharacterized protein n=1 Tax=Harpegnathos saltator TaxID=610380 RepID=E2B9I4_HARSA|nr:hypothetical protein EAI_10321 [Harpegnathos saltator]
MRRRLLALDEDLIKELIPQIGLRAGFLSSWKQLVADTDQQEACKKRKILATGTEDLVTEITDDTIKGALNASTVISEIPEASTEIALSENIDSEIIDPQPLPSTSTKRKTDNICQPSRHLTAEKACEELAVLVRNYCKQ